MWDAIRKNKRRSNLLLVVMALLLLALGASIGFAVEPTVGGIYGAGIAFGIFLLMMLVALSSGDSLMLASAGARKITKEDMPRYWNIVEEMTIASGLGKMPDVYIIENSVPNAFAVGRSQEKAAVAVTTGLLKRLDRDELQGVIAHEIGHIRNLDVRFMTIAGVMMGTIIMVSEVVVRGMFHSARFGAAGAMRTRSRSSGGKGNQAQIIFLVLALVLAILAPIMAQMLYFACSRRREYLADACGAQYTRYPEGLASALEQISSSHGQKTKQVSKALAPMYIINPLRASGGSGWFSTHPPTTERISILRAMGSAGWNAYEAAYRQVRNNKDTCIDERSLNEADDAPLREKSKREKKRGESVERLQQVNDMLATMGNYIFLSCACGLRIKVPPEHKANDIGCPKCGRQHQVIPTASG